MVAGWRGSITGRMTRHRHLHMTPVSTAIGRGQPSSTHIISIAEGTSVLNSLLNSLLNSTVFPFHLSPSAWRADRELFVASRPFRCPLVPMREESRFVYGSTTRRDATHERTLSPAFSALTHDLSQSRGKILDTKSRPCQGERVELARYTYLSDERFRPKDSSLSSRRFGPVIREWPRRQRWFCE